ncbi:hypothetical protein EOM39_00840 [Candidatus Gracilibacteria bacterium]|nr:hypothetical protein [Candidatus Gracilibacteria bacterium]
MGLTEILNEKKRQAESIKSKYKLLKKNKILGVIVMDNKEILSDLLKGLSVLPIDLIVLSKEEFGQYNSMVYMDNIADNTLFGVDFIVCDNCMGKLGDYLKKGIVPIVSKNNYLNNILNEFNPVKSEGNAFFYEEDNVWSIFYAIIRYLENHKFPYDNRNLVKNVIDIYY